MSDPHSSKSHPGSPLCSVVIPWHRNVGDLERAVASVFAQTEQRFEIVVVANNVRADDYAAACRISDDPRYRIVKLGRANASIARNHGLTIARGQLVFFLDADDIFYPEKLERFLKLRRDEGFDLAFSRGTRMRGDGVSWPFPIGHWDGGRHISEFFFCEGHTISGSAIVVDSAIRGHLAFDRGFVMYEDPDIVMRAQAMGMKVTMLPDMLYQWNDESDEGRLHALPDFRQRLAWIDQSGPAATERARAAFRARCVAQHMFPADFTHCLVLFARAAFARAIPLRELALFMLRGLLPDRLQRPLLDRYFKWRERRHALDAREAGPA